MMDAKAFKSARISLGLNQVGAAYKFGVTRQTIARWESGSSPVPSDVTFAPNVTSKGVTSPNVTPANVTPDPPAGLIPWKQQITKRDWVAQPVRPGWQRVADRVVHGSIAEPIPYDKPEWAKEFANADYYPVLTKSGRVFRSDTGAEIKPVGIMPRPPVPTMGSRLIDKAYKRRA